MRGMTSVINSSLSVGGLVREIETEGVPLREGFVDRSLSASARSPQSSERSTTSGVVAPAVDDDGQSVFVGGEVVGRR